jgi:S1-C subfamily serine protease
MCVGAIGVGAYFFLNAPATGPALKSQQMAQAIPEHKPLNQTPAERDNNSAPDPKLLMQPAESKQTAVEVKTPVPAVAKAPAPAEVKASPVETKAPPAETPKPAPETKKTPKKAPSKQPAETKQPAAGSGQLSPEVLAKVKDATVHIRVTTGEGRIGQGSGFFAYEPGLVLTNAHVLSMLEDNTPAPRQIDITYHSGESDSVKFQGKILGVDRNSDLAVLRVTGPMLPEPLEIKNAGGLVETQRVFVFGFPFGESLGKNITVSQSSVSSLRKENGELMKVQVNGGMQPGNSGGPVVNEEGEVVGVAVSIIQGTQINFAVPGEHVQQVLNGRVTTVVSGATVREGSDVKMKVTVNLLDPLNRVKKTVCDWWVASSGPNRPPSLTQPESMPGDTPRQQLELEYKAGKAVGNILVPTDLRPGQAIWLQPMIVNGADVTRWGNAFPFTPNMPLEPLPATLVLKHFSGARPIKLTSKSTLAIREQGKKEEKFTTNMVMKMSETMVSQQGSIAILRMRYLNYNLNVAPKPDPEEDQWLRRILPNVKYLHADLMVDESNKLIQNEADYGKLSEETKKDLKGLNSQITSSLEMLSIPLPGGVIQPNQTWKATRPLMVPGMGKKDLPLEVTYTFLGVREQTGRKEGAIRLNGVNLQKKGDIAVTAKITGMAYLDLASGQFSTAKVNGTVDLSIPKANQKLIVELESKMERTLGQEVLNVKESLSASDQKDPKGCAFKTHEVKLEEGKSTVVSLESPKGPKNFDTYIRVEDPSGKVVAKDDNSGVDLNAMVEFTPATAGTYKIIATTPRAGAMGDYNLIIRQSGPVAD